MTSPTKAPEPTEAERELAIQLADDYIRASNAGGEVYAKARTAVATASRTVSDLMAAHYAKQIENGKEDVILTLTNQVEPMWFKSGRDMLIAAKSSSPYHQMFVHCLTHGPIRKDVENAGLGRRIASVYGRAWVIAFILFPLAFVLFGAIAAKTPMVRIVLWAVFAGVLLLTLFLDSLVRRCPACKRWLAGMLVGLLDGGSYTENVTVETPIGRQSLQRERRAFIHSWVCVHCKHRWKR